jgi:RNA 2',3'-cyclic 3'-phosphodiesterase
VRLFVAIEIPPEIRSALAAFLKELRAAAPAEKWVRPENLHVTLKFLGETETAKLEQVKSALQAIRSPQAVALDFRGLGFFPNDKRPRVFWAGMESSDNLSVLARDIDSSLHGIGFSLEVRPFTPHLTLARMHSSVVPPGLSAVVKQNASRNFGSMSAREFHLIESKLKSSGAEYTTIQSFGFVAES